MSVPFRKSIRLKDYDYSANGVYFVTICTINRQQLFWNVGAIIDRPPEQPNHTRIGHIAEKLIKRIPQIYPNIHVEKYIVMPNHVHMLIHINKPDHTDTGRSMIAPTVSRIIQQYKITVTKEVGTPIWQKSFYEHIIRDEQDYQQIWRYIDENPAKWAQDCYYTHS